MHKRHLSLLAAMLVPWIAHGAAAQIHDQQAPTGPTYFVVNVQPGNFGLTATALRWGSPPRAAEPNVAARSGSSAQPRFGSTPGSTPGSKPTSNDIELMWPTPRTDSPPPQWMRIAGVQARSEITITAMSPAGQPVARYLLHDAVPTKFWVDKVDTGASTISLTHLTLTAQSITTVATGS